MKSLIENKLYGIPVTQNKQDFVIGVFTISQIFKFTKFTGRLIVDYDEKEEPIYNNQIQREVENSRVEKIADFLINDPEATFPTNIVLHIPKQVVLKQKKDERGGLEIHLNEKTFTEVKKNQGHVFISIIDGQHRIRGVEVAIARLTAQIKSLVETLATGKTDESDDLEKKLEYFRDRLNDLNNYEIIVSFFIDKSLEYQAMIFSTINRTQKRVSPSLVSSLFGLDTRDTPQKVSLQAVLKLNGHKNSPFYKRVKLYGGDYSEESPPLSQATMVRSIVSLICESLRESENDRFKSRRDLLIRSEASKKFLPFRKYYANDQDAKISDLLFFYFSAVRDIFKDKEGISYWNFDEDVKIENIFQSTVGYDTLLKILVDILDVNQLEIDQVLTSETKAAKESYFKKHLVKASKLNIADITRYSLNNRGKRILYLDLSIRIFPSSEFINEWNKELSDLLRLK